MTYNLEKSNDIYLFDNQIKWLRDNKKICELKEVKKNRTLSQNSALHLYFEHISQSLNEMGITFVWKGLKGNDMEIRYTAELVKAHIWKPIQITLFKKESTTKLTTHEMNEIITVLNKFFSERGVYIAFPSIESLIDREKLV